GGNATVAPTVASAALGIRRLRVAHVGSPPRLSQAPGTYGREPQECQKFTPSRSFAGRVLHDPGHGRQGTGPERLTRPELHHQVDDAHVDLGAGEGPSEE